MSDKTNDQLRYAQHLLDLAEANDERAMTLRIRAREVLNGIPGSGATPTTLREIAPADRRRLRRKAAEGIARFSLRRHDDGSAVARVEDKMVSLSPVLADLIAVLAEDDPDSATGPLVPFKPADEIRDRIDHWSEDNASNIVPANVHRLKRVLLLAGVNPYLVQSARAGYRLACRRAGNAA